MEIYTANRMFLGIMVYMLSDVLVSSIHSIVTSSALYQIGYESISY